MAKTQKKLQKNIKKVKEKQKKEYPLKNQIMYFAKTIYGILIVAILIYGITVIVNKAYKLEGKETKYDMTQILAGQTFSKLDKEYYVVFYDFDEQTDITTNIDSVSKKTIYKVDLGLGNNKNIISSVGNANASNASELQVNGPTIIKITDGVNAEYIEGLDNVNTYLKSL